jgi:hypothetical protein
MRGLSSSDDEEKRKGSPSYRHNRRASKTSSSTPTSLSVLASLLALAGAAWLWSFTDNHGTATHGRARSLGKVGRLTESERAAWDAVVERCEDLHRLPGVPESHWTRGESDRYQPVRSDYKGGRRRLANPLPCRCCQGTKPTLIRNATIWTGEDSGKEVLYNTDILLDRGLIVKIGENLDAGLEGLETFDANGAWVTPGIFDMVSTIHPSTALALSPSSSTRTSALTARPGFPRRMIQIRSQRRS